MFMCTRDGGKVGSRNGGWRCEWMKMTFAWLLSSFLSLNFRAQEVDFGSDRIGVRGEMG